MHKPSKSSSVKQSKAPLIISVIIIAGLILAYFFIPEFQGFLNEAWNVLSSNDEERIKNLGRSIRMDGATGNHSGHGPSNVFTGNSVSGFNGSINSRLWSGLGKFDHPCGYIFCIFGWIYNWPVFWACDSQETHRTKNREKDWRFS